MTTIYKNVIGR